MAKIWYTQPPSEFDSFYYYDDSKRELVRIRLELGRSDGSGDTKAMYLRDRYVGFTSYNDLKTRVLTKWTVASGQIKYNEKILRDSAVVGDWTYDFSLPTGKVNPYEVHAGNKVASSGRLPPKITQDDLIKLAQLTLAAKKDIVLTGKNAKAAELSEAIQKAISTD
jgi:hypothetical protein